MTATTTPTILVIPTITLERGTAGHAVTDGERVAFNEAFRDAIEGTALARGYALAAADGPCEKPDCAHAMATRTGARSWIAAVVVRTESECRARATLYDLGRARVARQMDSTIAPCTPQRLLMGAEDLGHKIAEGPRHRPPASVALTSLSVPDLNIPALPSLVITPTVSPPIEDVERAVSQYRKSRYALANNGEGSVIVVQGDVPVSDCDLFVIAGYRPTATQTEICEGNAWELGWLGAPFGALLLAPGIMNTAEGDSPALLIGALALAMGGPALAWWLNEDQPDAARGEHVVSLDQLENLIEAANETLRTQLKLHDAELRVRGL